MFFDVVFEIIESTQPIHAVYYSLGQETMVFVFHALQHKKRNKTARKREREQDYTEALHV